MREKHVLLKGMTGSHAYGMATPDSDEDWYGIFAYPTEDLVTLHQPPLTVVERSPDLTMHEAGKYAKLALSCNPSVLDLLWLPEYEFCTELGRELTEIRESFLKARGVRDAYLGYARQQFKRITMRGDNSFSSDTRKRTAKHARHLLRLCEQGWQLYSTGTMSLRVADPDGLRAFGEKIANGQLHLADQLLAEYAEKFKEPSVLPKHSDELLAERWLQKVRRTYAGPVLQHQARLWSGGP